MGESALINVLFHNHYIYNIYITLTKVQVTGRTMLSWKKKLCKDKWRCRVGRRAERCVQMSSATQFYSFVMATILTHLWNSCSQPSILLFFALTQSFWEEKKQISPYRCMATYATHLTLAWFNLSLMFSTAALVWQETQLALIYVCHWEFNVFICEVVFWRTFVQNVCKEAVHGGHYMAEHRYCTAGFTEAV